MSHTYQELYKNNGLDSEEMRRRREKEKVELRKQNREERLLKKRNVISVSGEQTESSTLQLLISSMLTSLNSDNEIEQISATQTFHKILSTNQNPPDDLVTHAGIIKRLIQFLESNNSVLQFEAARVVANVASGKSLQTRAVVGAGAVPVLIKLLSSQDDNLLEQAAWTLGNIVGDSANLRDYVLSCGIVEPILKLLYLNKIKIEALRHATWTISNLCIGNNSPPDFQIVSPFIPALSRLLFHSDTDVLSDAVFAFAHITKWCENIQVVIELSTCRRMVELLMHNSHKVTRGALFTIRNILRGSHVQAQVVLNCSLLSALSCLLKLSPEWMKKDVCSVISKIAASNTQQTQSIFDADIVPTVLEILKRGDFKSKGKAAWIIAHIIANGSSDHVGYLVDEGCIPLLCNLLSIMDTNVIRAGLCALENILKHGSRINQIGDNPNPYAMLIEECKGLDQIEFLQTHDNTEICNKAFRIVERYFYDEDGITGIFASVE